MFVPGSRFQDACPSVVRPPKLAARELAGVQQEADSDIMMKKMNHHQLLLLFFTLVAAKGGAAAFLNCGSNAVHCRVQLSSSTQQQEPKKNKTKARSKPRSGIAQELLNIALKSPLWTYVLVPQARQSIVKTAESNGIQWMNARNWLNSMITVKDYSHVSYPEYYRKSFHAYSDGNLSYDAAVEQELASRAVGARNFPKFGKIGEDVFRGAFDRALSVHCSPKNTP